MKNADKYNAIYSNTMFSVIRIRILGVIIEKHDSNARDIVQLTGISKDIVCRELNVLKNAGIITAIMYLTKSGFKKKAYKVNFSQYHLLWTKRTE